MGTVLRNIRPVTGTDRLVSLRFEGSVVVDSTEEEMLPKPGDVEIDADRKLAFSGFANTHTHLAMVLFRGFADGVPLRVWLEDYIWPIERKLQPEDVYWCTLLALAEAIRGGTTCVADMYFHTNEVARAVEESGLRALLSYGMVADSLDDRGRSELATTRKLIERWNSAGEGRIGIAVSPHAVYTCGEDVWREALEMARDLGVPVHTHLAETRSEVETWKAQTGMSPVAYLDRIGAFDVPTVAAHCVHVDERDIAILADRDVRVAHCPKSNAKLGSGVAPVAAMRRAGVAVALGTDGAASNNRLDMVEEMRAAWILQRGHNEDPESLSGHDAFRMATDVGREALMTPSEGLSVGGAADVVLLDPSRSHTCPTHDPIPLLAYAASSADVTDVIVDGQILLKNGELLTIDEERVQSEVERLLRRLGI